jgi:hypothetical protein
MPPLLEPLIPPVGFWLPAVEVDPDVPGLPPVVLEPEVPTEEPA